LGDFKGFSCGQRQAVDRAIIIAIATPVVVREVACGSGELGRPHRRFGEV
jgi:hypothetical protein